MRLCVAPAGSKVATHGSQQAGQISRLADYILKRVILDPSRIKELKARYVDSESFSNIRPELVAEILKQSEGLELSWKIKKEFILPMEIQTAETSTSRMAK